MLVRGERSNGVRLTGLLSLGNLLGKKLVLGKRKILSCQARSRKEGFYATVFSAVTPVSRALAFRGPWQPVMPPLSADAIKSSQDAPFDDDSATDAGSQNGAKHHGTTSACAIDCLRDGKTVRIVFEPNWLLQSLGNITVQWLAIEHNTI
jgi:hypothetical protein